MRLALCLSGLPRFEADCIEQQLRACAGALQIDIFAHFWEADEAAAEAARAELARRVGQAAEIVAVSFAAPYQHPRAVQAMTYPETKLANVFSMYRGIALADALVRAHEHGQRCRYDAVIRSRTDIFLDRPLDLPRLARVLDEFVVLPRNGHWRGGLCDQWALGSSMRMAGYAHLFARLEPYLEAGVIAHPETLLRHHLERLSQPVMLADTQTILVRDGQARIG